MTTQLSIYNQALAQIGETPLANLSEGRESRYLLDGVWDSLEGLDDCLTEGFWKFAVRFVKWTPDPSVTVAFGLPYAYSFPTDYLRAYGVWQDELQTTPLLDYKPQGERYLYAAINPIYLAYISNDVLFGRNLANWTSAFTRYVELYFAFRIGPKALQSQPKIDALEKRMHKALVRARSLDAMELATEMPAVGGWVRSRYGRSSGWDRGNTGRLIG